MTHTTGMIIVLNGFPGTGKLTILKQMKKLLPPNSTCLLDNHLLIDPVAAVIPHRNDEHYQLRRSVRKPVFEKLRKLAQEGYIILMTACLAAKNEQDATFLGEHLDIARGTDVPIFWINVHCNEKVLEHRLSSSERCLGTKTKLTDVSILQDLLMKHSLVLPSNISDQSMKLVVKSLDVSGPVEMSVKNLMDMAGLCEDIGLSI